MTNKKDDKAKRVQMTLKPDVVDELDRLAKEWGTTRSGMVTILTKLRVDHDSSELLAEKMKDR
ncbi:MAG: hypothetical protein GX180_06580 [Enterococcus sp.]|nr:hypothetical protein [Enterococcus sp.]